MEISSEVLDDATHAEIVPNNGPPETNDIPGKVHRACAVGDGG